MRYLTDAYNQRIYFLNQDTFFDFQKGAAEACPRTSKSVLQKQLLSKMLHYIVVILFL